MFVAIGVILIIIGIIVAGLTWSTWVVAGLVCIAIGLLLSLVPYGGTSGKRWRYY